MGNVGIEVAVSPSASLFHEPARHCSATQIIYVVITLNHLLCRPWAGHQGEQNMPHLQHSGSNDGDWMQKDEKKIPGNRDEPSRQATKALPVVRYPKRRAT